MTLKLNLSSAPEGRLVTEASISGMTVEAFVLALLERTLPSVDHNRALSALLSSWLSSDDTEQKETGRFLIKALDEDRLSDRPLFPDLRLQPSLPRP